VKIKVIRGKNLAPYIDPDNYYGFDIETTGKDSLIEDEITIITLYSGFEERAYIIPIRTQEYIADISDKQKLAEVLDGLDVVGHHLQFDLSHICYEFQTYPTPLGDTFLLSRILQKKKQSLGDMAREAEMDIEIKSFTDVIDDPSVYPSVKDKEFLTYCAYDAYAPIQIENYFKSQDNWDKFADTYYRELEFLDKVVIKSYVEGLKVNIDDYEEIMYTITQKKELYQQKLDDIAGKEINVNSHQQVREWLFEDLGLEPTPVKTSTGKPSTSQEALAYLSGIEEVEALQDLKEYASAHKGSKNFPEHLSADGRIHPYFKQLGFDGTPRVYYKPSVTSYPEELRKVFVPSEGKKFLYADWSSAELIAMAYWAGCDELIQAYENGEDLHRLISSRILDKDDISEEEREVSKIVSFSIIYGSEGDSIARNLQIPRSEGVAYKDKFLDEFIEIDVHCEYLRDITQNTTYTYTYFGRPRRLPHVKSTSSTKVERALRQSVNSAIQGTIADCVKIAANRVADIEDCEFRMSVFDSLLIEVPESMTESEAEEMLDRLSDFRNVGDNEGFKLRYHYDFGSTWYDASANV